MILFPILNEPVPVLVGEQGVSQLEMCVGVLGLRGLEACKFGIGCLFTAFPALVGRLRPLRSRM